MKRISSPLRFNWVTRLFDLASADNWRFLYAAAATIAIVGGILAFRDAQQVRSLDEPAFYDLASNLAKKHQFAHTNSPEKHFYEPNEPEDQLRLTAYRAPGYPFFLCSFVAVGADYPALRTVNALLMAATLVILSRFLASTYGAFTANVCVVMVLAYPVLLYTATILYPQTLASFLLVGLFVLMCRIEPTSNAVYVGMTGIVYGLLILTVPIFVLCAPLFGIWMVYTVGSRVGFRHATVFLTFAAASTGVWTVRNYDVFGSFVPVATSAGFNLYCGNNPKANYNSSIQVEWPEHVYAKLTGMNEVESNHYLVAEAFDYIVRNPGRFAVLYIQKFLHWFSYDNKLVSDAVIEKGASSLSVNLRSVVMLVTWTPLLGIFAARLFLVRRFPMTNIEKLILITFLGGALAYSLFFTRIRFRIPFDWLLIAGNSIFVSRVAERMKNQIGFNDSSST